MTDNHLITPPPELVEEWFNNSPIDRGLTLATQAAQWGADQELEACCVQLGYSLTQYLRDARRPKPPSLKEQALAAQQRMWDGTSNHDDWNLIRRALEALND